MYCSQLVFFAVLLTTHSVLSQKFDEIKEACNKEIGFDGDIETLHYNDPAFPKEAKCALACALDKKGVFKADGSIDREKEKAIPEEIIKDDELKKKYHKAIDECDASAKANKCETAYEFVKCLKNKVM
ncbi:general odorant-binding protein 28a [Halyomorpha halys]|uniref:general odorant-binding protein 28a n=1 Tax=Halyomorpha halys TaxID=286706 RepID=UPI0006D4DD2A|nr:uncharacterized protein LOC106688334 [Halyomorpha halys]KAE8573079.1 Odorant-binding protein 45 [Halyomorpha halys]